MLVKTRKTKKSYDVLLMIKKIHTQHNKKNKNPRCQADFLSKNSVFICFGLKLKKKKQSRKRKINKNKQMNKMVRLLSLSKTSYYSSI